MCCEVEVALIVKRPTEPICVKIKVSTASFISYSVYLRKEENDEFIKFLHRQCTDSDIIVCTKIC